jgi:glycosyltransferase involved in cell wall biosynthesis
MKNRLKIALYSEGFFTGGTERQLTELIKRLDRNRFEAYAISSRQGGQLESELMQAGIAIENFPLTCLRDFNAIKQLWRLKNFLLRKEIDLLHTFSLTGNTFGVLAGLLARVPTIITSRRDMGVMIPPLYWPLQIAFSLCADAIVINAAAIRDMLITKERVSPDKIKLVHNGIDLKSFSIDSETRRWARRELGIDEKTVAIGVIAQIKPVKGHRYLLLATQLLKKRLANFRILIIGDGAQRPELEAFSTQLGIKEQTLFLGQRNDVKKLIAAFDIGLLPSLSEGLSNSLLEMMAAGVPAIATDVGGNREIIIDKETGLLVPPANPEAIATAIETLLNDADLSARLANKARKMVMNRFSTEHMVDCMENLYLDLAQKNWLHQKTGVKDQGSGIRAEHKMKN